MWYMELGMRLVEQTASLFTIGAALIAIRRYFPAVWDGLLLSKSPRALVKRPFRFYDVQLGMAELVANASRFQPQAIIGINRGGAIVGGILGKHLDLYVHVIEVRNSEPVSDCWGLPEFVRNKRVLLVDDRYSTGVHLSKAYDYLKPYASEIRTAVFAYVRFTDAATHSFRGPDFYAYSVLSAAISLPWERRIPYQWGKQPQMT